jgi:DNA invertase Pin-like site-specific DNA recombinase
VAKLDRLARNVAFLAALQESGVEFVACDQPHANRLTLDILSAVAEDEARRTSERTRAALAQKKARGFTLGHPDTLTAEGRAAGRAAVLAKRGDRFAVWAARHRHTLNAFRARGGSLRELADALGSADVPTPTGRFEWHATTVLRVLARLDDQASGYASAAPI